MTAYVYISYFVTHLSSKTSCHYNAISLGLFNLSKVIHYLFCYIHVVLYLKMKYCHGKMTLTSSVKVINEIEF